MSRIRASRAVPIAGFFVLLLAPGVLQLLQLGVSSPRQVWATERRWPAALPSFPTRIPQWKELPSRLEDWFADSFGGRAWLVRANGWLRYRLGSSVHPDRVVIGEDGWLYLGSAWSDPIQQQRGSEEVAAAEIERTLSVIKARHAWLGGRGIPFLFVVAPDKANIYREHLPAWARSRRGKTRREVLVQRLRRAGIPVVDPTEALEAAKATGPVYSKTDSHWTDYGAFVVYGEIMRYLQDSLGFQGLVNLTKGSRQPLIRPGRAGPLAFQLGLAPEDLEDLEVTVQLSDVPEVTMFNALEERLPGGNQPVRMYSLWTARTEVRDAPTALVLRDSFTTNMSRYLNGSFQGVSYAHHSSAVGREMTSAVERHAPDVVILVQVERDLRRPELIHPSWAGRSGRLPLERFARMHRRVIAESGARLRNRIVVKTGGKWVGAGRRSELRAISGSILHFRALPVQGEGRLFVRFDIVSETTGYVVIRHRVREEGEAWRNVPFPLWPGPNTICLKLPAVGLRHPVSLSFMRDPEGLETDEGGGDVAYALHGWEVRRRGRPPE